MMDIFIVLKHIFIFISYVLAIVMIFTIIEYSFDKVGSNVSLPKKWKYRLGIITYPEESIKLGRNYAIVNEGDSIDEALNGRR